MYIPFYLYQKLLLVSHRDPANQQGRKKSFWREGRSSP
jgi:hypothetical protein